MKKILTLIAFLALAQTLTLQAMQEVPQSDSLPKVFADESDTIGWTPLMLAAYSGDVDCIQVFLSIGADPKILSSKDTSLPIIFHNHQITQVFPKGSDAFTIAVLANHLSAASALIRALGKDYRCRYFKKYGITRLMIAAASGNTQLLENELIEKLRANPQSIYSKTKKDFGAIRQSSTALHITALFGHQAVITKLHSFMQAHPEAFAPKQESGCSSGYKADIDDEDQHPTDQ